MKYVVESKKSAFLSGGQLKISPPGAGSICLSVDQELCKGGRMETWANFTNIQLPVCQKVRFYECSGQPKLFQNLVDRIDKFSFSVLMCPRIVDSISRDFWCLQTVHRPNVCNIEDKGQKD